MNSLAIEEICKNENVRIPLEYRKDKISAAKFLLETSTLNVSDIKNPGWFALQRWLDDSRTDHDYDEIVSIEKLNEERTFDLTVPDGNSFSANGITVHNCNLPSDTTRETVAQVYMTAWESGCKGFTVYRDGCRTGVLVAEEPKKASKAADDLGQPVAIEENHAPKRPKELPCDIHRINVKGSAGPESYLVLVGRLDGKPYEVFCGLSSHVEVPKKVKSGVLIKNGKKDGVATYNLSIPVGDDDVVVFKDVVELFANPVHGVFTRTISLALRHGVPVSYICEQVRKDKHSDIQSFSTVLSRVLKNYIKDGTKSASDKTCGSCGTENSLVYKEGCVTCASCGWSRC
jgi:ribonucleoside-diphosphate reductase alpha chain